MSTYSLNTPQWIERPKAHIESFFLKANSPTEAKALWIKVTYLDLDVTSANDGVIDLWCCVFDSTDSKYYGLRQRHNASAFQVAGETLKLERDDLAIEFGSQCGRFKATLTDGDRCLELDLEWQAVDSPLGRSYSLLPYHWMLNGPLPKQKTITPIGLCRLSGTLKSEATDWTCEGWLGCQGHNWGRAHTPDYVWLHTVLFENGIPVGICEAFTGRVRLGPFMSPKLSGAVLRFNDETYRLDKITRFWHQRSILSDGCYHLSISDGEVRLEIAAKSDLEQTVCLGYQDPSGQMNYCMNSKLSSATIILKTAKKTRRFDCANHVALEWLDAHAKGAVI